MLLDISRLPDVAAVPVVLDEEERRHTLTAVALPFFLHIFVCELELTVAAVRIGRIVMQRADLIDLVKADTYECLSVGNVAEVCHLDWNLSIGFTEQSIERRWRHNDKPSRNLADC